MELQLPAVVTTFTAGVAAGYIGTLILEKIGKFILLFLAMIFGGMILFMLWLQNMGFAYIFWSRFIDWIFSLIINIITWISLHALPTSTSLGTFTTGTIVGMILRLSRRGRTVSRRKMFKFD